MNILTGVKIVEIEGIGPGPFCAMALADLGADVVTLCRPGAAEGASGNIVRRGKRVIAADLKSEQDRAHCLDLVGHADGLIEGMRPGVMERLGLGPDVCLKRNPRLAYGRLTGWGQEGPLSGAAGHDINYIALSGALWYSGRAGTPPFAPPTLVGDIAGGALYLAIGMLSAILKARETGRGDVIDAAIVDGSAHMMNLLLTAWSAGVMNEPRGASMLDGSHWYDSFECEDGAYISLGPLEPQFYRLLLEKLGLENDPDFAEQYNPTSWPKQKEKLAGLIRTKTQSQWSALLEGADVCFAPVLSPSQAAEHPHMKARGTYTNANNVMQAAPAPRFQNHSTSSPPEPATTTTFGAALTSWQA